MREGLGRQREDGHQAAGKLECRVHGRAGLESGAWCLVGQRIRNVWRTRFGQMNPLGSGS